MNKLGLALRSVLALRLVRNAVRRCQTQLLGWIAIIVVASTCVALAVGFGAWAAFAALRDSVGPAAAAAWVALALALVAALAIGIGVALRRARARRAPDYTQFLTLVNGMELPKLGAGTVIAGGLALGLLVGLTLNRPK